MMKSLYALIVAIDDYPDGVPSLRGCVNDASSFEMYLKEKYSENAENLHIKWLKNTAATRQNIIDGFDHYNQAKDGDICVLFYGGHGSQVKAPKEFHHIEPNHQCQTMVCYDSRTEGGRDLVDKELSYLLWKATHDREIHFVAVMDCCHSGGNTRDTHVFPRMARQNGNFSEASGYLGVEHYMKVETSTGVNLTPPRGRYIQLAAARDKETAKEMSISGNFRGIFTFNLIKLLLTTKGNLTYSNIIEQLGPRIALQARDQSPQLDTTVPDMRNATFLDGTVQPFPEHFLISFDRDERAWVLNAGETQGIAVTGGGNGTLLALEDGSEVTVTQTWPHKAKVDGRFGMSIKKQHIAYMKQAASDPLKIAFAPETEKAAKDLILKNYTEKSYPLYKLNAPLDDCNFWLWSVGGQWWLSRPDEPDSPLYPKMTGDSTELALIMLDNFSKVSKGVSLMELSNPQTTLNPDNLEIEISQITEPGNTEDSAPAEKMDTTKPLVFETDGVNMPAFRLKIKNKSKEVLWVSAIFMDDIFEITNKYLPKRDLDPGKEVWLTEVVENRRQGTRTEYKTIPLYLPEDMDRLEDYIKIIACTEEFNTDKYNQKPVVLDMDGDGPTRRGGRKPPMDQPDWMTKELRLVVQRKG